MPITIDITKNKVFARAYQRGWQEGYREAALIVLRRQIERRFGAIPGWAEERLASRSTSELEDLIDRVLDAPSLEDLMK